MQGMKSYRKIHSTKSPFYIQNIKEIKMNLWGILSHRKLSPCFLTNFIKEHSGEQRFLNDGKYKTQWQNEVIN